MYTELLLGNSWKGAAWKLEQEMRIMEQVFKEVMFDYVNCIELTQCWQILMLTLLNTQVL